ncbi:hypothetical protein CHLRE_12g539700v5 [Chlamydomonas reinhardtii]|uniref:Ankyrin repeat domain-containing protein n=1 Tax=Chlamydomonas reinhardtii TaxID=3055 RepID=A0A2K3D6Z7_CHLRE|nr:uncharacterized protein CHLRE_12g539700v5 [Chlamydomonas reinhardtii]PNW76309.1 hypothetical protein CHLRE_12g539700v5 [Chlamydomonas reinhardtii]
MVLSSPEHKRVRASQPLPAHGYSSLPTAAIQQWPFAQRQQLVCDAARSGSLEAVDAALAATGVRRGGWLLAAAAEASEPGAALRLCQQLAARGWLVEDWAADRTTLHAAAAAGNSDVCKWLVLERNCIPQRYMQVVCAAAEAGHVAVVAELLSLCPTRHKPDMHAQHLLVAAARGYKAADFTRLWKECMDRAWEELRQQQQRQQETDELDVFSVQFPNGLWLDISSAMKPISEVLANPLADPLGSLGMLSMLEAAAGSPTPCWLDKLDVLLQLPSGDEAAAAAAASGGELLAQPGLLSRVFAASLSAPDGLARVRLLWEQRSWRLTKWTNSQLVAAAGARGDTAAISYLFNKLRAVTAAPFHPAAMTLRRPAEGGHLPVLQLFASHGARCTCDIFVDMAGAAAKGGHVHILDYLLCKEAPPHFIRGEPGSWADVRAKALRRALELGIEHGHTSVVRFLHELGARLPASSGWSCVWRRAGRAGNPALLGLLVELGYPIDREESVYCEARRDVAMIRALARLRFCGDDCLTSLELLLEDPAVPLDELRWLLEGDGGGGEPGGEGGAGGPSGGQAARAPEPGPAARRVLRDERVWEWMLEAVRRRGQGEAALVVEAWLEGWWRANKD